MLVEMNPLLESDDPVLRDDVAYSAAERWILREHRLSPSELRRCCSSGPRTWTTAWERPATIACSSDRSRRCACRWSPPRICRRPFSSPPKLRAFFDRMLDYFQRERDLRGFDPVHGWMHTVAHTSDALKFLARNPKLAAGSDVAPAGRGPRQDRIVTTRCSPGEKTIAWRWRCSRRSAARTRILPRSTAWTQYWVTAHRTLWANGPQVDPRRFATVENAAQVMRSLHAALSMETCADAYGTGGAPGVDRGAGEDALDACSGGTRPAHGRASSSAAASWSTTCSSAGLAPSWMPIGSPLECIASGSEIAGVPRMLCGSVN